MAGAVPKPIFNRTVGVVSYTCFSTFKQDVAGQGDRLAEANSVRVFSFIVSGAAAGRSEQARLIGHA